MTKICAAYIDPQATTVLIILLVLSLVFSFAVSGAEVAFFSLTFKDVNLLKTKQQLAYKRIVNLLETPKILYGALYIANTFASIAVIIIASLLIDDLLQLKEMTWGWFAAFFAKAIIISSLLILFAQVLPKMYARQNNLRFAKDFGSITEGVFYIFGRMGNWLMTYSDLLETKLGKKNIETLTEEELQNTSSEERNILKGVEKFGDITVKQIMRTRLDVSAISEKVNFEELLKCIQALHYSRIPVYKESLDEISGMIHTKDVLPYIDEKENYDWHTLMRPVYFVHENKLIEDLLREFQSKRMHFAVVVDEFGGTSGIVTMEDIMEEIIGDIKDEFDEDDGYYKKLDEYNYIFEGKTMIYDVCKALKIPLSTFDKVKGESDSLAGLMLEIAGEIPKLNQAATSGDFKFTALEVEKNRLLKIKVSIKHEENKVS